MTRSGGKKFILPAAVALSILAAYAFRFSGVDALSYVRTGIYLTLFVLWGISVSQRITHPEIRRMLVAVAVLMVFWMSARTVKFALPDSHPVGRYCWYLYYPPMLLIPLMTTFVAALLGRPESYRLPRWTTAVYAAAVAMVIFVLTNDLHQLVFVFDTDFAHYVDGQYSYGVGFIPIAIWRYGGLLATLGLVFVKSRLPGKGRRILAPIIPALLLVAYHVCYLLEFSWLRFAFGDLTVAECLLVVSILESCLRTGLIPSNAHYGELMQMCNIPMVIVDDDYAQVICSDVYSELPTDALRSAESGPVELENGCRLSSAPLKNGRVLWENDVSALTDMRRELQSTRERLRRRNALQAEEYRTLRHREELAAKNRLYDLLQRQTAPKVEKLHGILAELDEVRDPSSEDRLLLQAAVLGAYIKRRNNLALLGESQSAFAAGELKNCLDESLRNMEIFGLAADCRFALRGEIAFGRMILLYEVFEAVVERALGSMTELMVTLMEKEQSVVMTMRLCSNEDLLPLSSEGIAVSDEGDGEWLVTFALPEGGDAA